VSSLSLFAIVIGGAFGAVSRHAICTAQPRWTALPGWTGVLAANVLGCLVIGVAAGWSTTGVWQHAFVMTGVCGALTTFSSFALDLALLLLAGRRASATACAALSLSLGIPAVLIGMSIGRAVS